jgi:S1-C subfamily serine protease
MRRPALALLLLVIPLTDARPACAQADAELQKVEALQQVLHKVITKVEPSVGCILISRSDAYRTLGLGPDKACPGKLGDFDPDSLKHKPGLSSPQERALWRRKLDLADPGHVPQAFGSGVVIDPDGLILTNYHVVQDATKVFVRLPGGKASYADIHAADPRSDLAVLRLLNPHMVPLPPIRLGDADQVKRGHFILSIANVFAAGFRDGQPSASWGILSNIRRRAGTAPRDEDQTKPLHYYGTLLQTDARLHLGCSGGAIVNLQGEMIGLSTALAAIQGGETPGGYAVPINAGLRRVIDVLRRGEEVDYGFLGVGFDDRLPDGAPGVGIANPIPGSPAVLDGKFKGKEVIVSINGMPLTQSDDLLVALGSQMAGSTVRLEYRRGKDKEMHTVDVILSKMYVAGKKIHSSLGKRPYCRGLRVDYTSILVQKQPRLDKVPPGVMVSEVQPNSAAERAFFKPGDVITHVNGTAVNTPTAFYQQATDGREALELTLYNYSAQDPPGKVILR